MKKVKLVYAVGQGHNDSFMVYRLYSQEKVALDQAEFLNSAIKNPPLAESEKFRVKTFSLV